MSKELDEILYDYHEDQGMVIAKKMAEFAATAATAQATIASSEEVLAKQKKDLAVLLELTIPDFMAEAGVSEFKLTDGTTVAIKPFTRARLAQPEAGLTWLEDNGHDGVIKHTVAVPFGKEPGEDYIAVRSALEAIGVDYTDERTVHPQTLTALVRELMARGEPVPMDAFGVFTGKVAKITTPKSK